MITADILIIDGYNVANHWLKEGFIKRGNLDILREQLIHTICSCAGFWGVKCLIVFDAYQVKGQQGSHEELNQWVDVIYSAEAQTADSLIERLTYELLSTGQSVMVITSDWLEQTMIMGHGARRMTNRELLLSVKQAKREMESRFIAYPRQTQRNWLEDSLSPKNRELLSKWRDSRKKTKE